MKTKYKKNKIRYIYESKKWPHFVWNTEPIALILEQVRFKQGRFIGKMEALGFNLKDEAVLQTLTEDVLKTSEIEGEKLDRNQVRSSLATRLGMDIIGSTSLKNRNVDGLVEMMLDATQKYREDLTVERLFSWHAALFPTGRNGLDQISVGQWRDDSEGPMQVISGPMGKAKIHFKAPTAQRIKKEIKNFLEWFNAQKKTEDSILRAAMAHLWFVTIHPFDDGNGRIARAITDMSLARSEFSSKRFYSMSARISIERTSYYEILERTQKGGLDITVWFEWFLSCFDRAIDGADIILESVLKKAKFWDLHKEKTLNDRQRKIIIKLMDGFEGHLTSSKWALLGKCSQDTATRDIQELLHLKILKKNSAGGRSTNYSLK